MTKNDELRIERRHIREIVAYLDSDDYHPAMTDAIAALAAALSATPAEDGETESDEDEGEPVTVAELIRWGVEEKDASEIMRWYAYGHLSDHASSTIYALVAKLRSIASPVPAAAPAEGPGEGVQYLGERWMEAVARIKSCADLLHDEANDVPGIYNVDSILRRIAEDLALLRPAPVVPGDEDERVSPRLIEAVKGVRRTLGWENPQTRPSYRDGDLIALVADVERRAARPVPAVPQENK